MFVSRSYTHGIRSFVNTLKTLKGDKRGVSAVEYGILAAVVVTGATVALPPLWTAVAGRFSTATTAILGLG